MMRVHAQTLTGPRQQADRIRTEGWADVLEGIAKALSGSLAAGDRTFLGRAWRMVIPAVTASLAVQGAVANTISINDHYSAAKVEEAAERCVMIVREETPLVYEFVTGQTWASSDRPRAGGLGRGLDALVAPAGDEWPRFPLPADGEGTTDATDQPDVMAAEGTVKPTERDFSDLTDEEIAALTAEDEMAERRIEDDKIDRAERRERGGH